jgi:hypothetical protein
MLWLFLCETAFQPHHPFSSLAGHITKSMQGQMDRQQTATSKESCNREAISSRQLMANIVRQLGNSNVPSNIDWDQLMCFRNEFFQGPSDTQSQPATDSAPAAQAGDDNGCTCGQKIHYSFCVQEPTGGTTMLICCTGTHQTLKLQLC